MEINIDYKRYKYSKKHRTLPQEVLGDINREKFLEADINCVGCGNVFTK